MPSKTSFLNKSIIKNIVRRFYWMGALYFLALLVAYPLNILASLPTERYPHFSAEYIFKFGYMGFHYILMFVVPVLVAAFLFHYLQGKSSSDMIHSLPISRSKLYNHHIFMGLIFLVIPIVSIALISWIITIIFNLGEYITLMEILKWTGTMLLMNIVLFMSTVFAGIVTGISIVQVILTYIVLFLPTGFIYLIAHNLVIFLHGFSVELYINNSIMRLSPLLRIDSLSHKPLSWAEVLGYSIFCLTLYFLGKYLYKKRKLERNLQVIVFRTLYHIFKYGVTLSFMLLGGVYFNAIRGSLPWLYFGYVFSSFIGFCIAEGVLQKSVRIFSKNAFKSYFIYLATIILILTGLSFDITGFERRVPEVADIEGVYMDNGMYRYRYPYGEVENSFYKTVENITSIHNIHKTIIAEGDHRRSNRDGFDRYEDIRNISIVYHLKNGRRVARNYVVSYPKYEEQLEQIYGTLEDKLLKYPILKVTTPNVKKITINPNNAPYGRPLTFVKPDEVQEALDILKEEIIDASADELLDNRAPWASIYIQLNEPLGESGGYNYEKHIPEIYTSWNKNFTKFEAWLEEKGYLEEARVMPDQVSYVVVEKIESQEDMYQFERGVPVETKEKDEATKSINRLESHDQEDIEISLLNFSDSWNNTYPRYIVGFYNKSKQQMFMGSFVGENVPQFVKDHFEK